jgi:hypothetical protein
MLAALLQFGTMSAAGGFRQQNLSQVLGYADTADWFDKPCAIGCAGNQLSRCPKLLNMQTNFSAHSEPGTQWHICKTVGLLFTLLMFP